MATVLGADSRLHHGESLDGARWYDPTVGRWPSEDPSGLTVDADPYRYAGNAPTNGADPSGLFDLANEVKLLDADTFAVREQAQQAIQDQPVTPVLFESLASYYYSGPDDISFEQRDRIGKILRFDSTKLEVHGFGDAVVKLDPTGKRGVIAWALAARQAANDVINTAIPQIIASVEAEWGANTRRYFLGSPKTDNKLSINASDDAKAPIATSLRLLWGCAKRTGRPLTIQLALTLSGSLLSGDLDGEYRIFCGSTNDEPISEGTIKATAEMKIEPISN